MEWEQEQYDLKRQLNCEQAARRYLEEEVENLQKDIQRKDEILQSVSKQLKTQNDQHKASEEELKTKVENLEELLKSERKEHSSVVKKLKDEIVSAEAVTNKHDSSSLLNIKNLKENIETLELKVEKLETELEQLMEDKAGLAKRNEEISQIKDDLEHALLSKREELASCIERCSALEEEVILLKVENDTFKNAPQSHSKKGNSVFAEIDDNRRALKNGFEELSKKYNGSKKIIKTKTAEISKLRSENCSLLKKIKEMSSRNETYESKLINDYKIRIKDLESTIEDLKKESNYNLMIQRNLSDDFRKIDSIFAGKRKEIENLKEKIDQLSHTIILKSESIFFLRRDLDSKTTELALELSEKMRLKEQLEEAKHAEQ